MKKIISVLLAALMLMSCFAVVSFAETAEHKCEKGTHVSVGYCTCCLLCPNVDDSYVLGCADRTTGATCCADCSGIYPCNCRCTCCSKGDQTGTENDGKDILTPEQQENFVDGFQAFLKKISDFFDDLFDKIFEFLKVDEVLGKK